MLGKIFRKNAHKGEIRDLNHAIARLGGES